MALGALLGVDFIAVTKMTLSQSKVTASSSALKVTCCATGLRMGSAPL